MATVLEAKTCVKCDSKFVPKSVRQKFCGPDCRNSKAPATAPLEFTLTDTSNHLLATGPSALSCGVAESGEEPQLILTIRTSSSTVTIALTEKEASAWLAEIARRIKMMQDARTAG